MTLELPCSGQKAAPAIASSVARTSAAQAPRATPNEIGAYTAWWHPGRQARRAERETVRSRVALFASAIVLRQIHSKNDRFLEDAYPSSGNWRSGAMKPTAILLGIVLVLTVSACVRRDDPPPGSGMLSPDRTHYSLIA